MTIRAAHEAGFEAHLVLAKRIRAYPFPVYCPMAHHSADGLAPLRQVELLLLLSLLSLPLFDFCGQLVVSGHHALKDDESLTCRAEMLRRQEEPAEDRRHVHVGACGGKHPKVNDLWDFVFSVQRKPSPEVPAPKSGDCWQRSEEESDDLGHRRVCSYPIVHDVLLTDEVLWVSGATKLHESAEVDGDRPHLFARLLYVQEHRLDIHGLL
mmetsp:Transcript_90315/g.254916  ORF Transcript_90315/g.254916 Transcript_90315/m.254916 type:complete len:210 (+) Transcript_90315:947-1576(+)